MTREQLAKLIRRWERMGYPRSWHVFRDIQRVLR